MKKSNKKPSIVAYVKGFEDQIRKAVIITEIAEITIKPKYKYEFVGELMKDLDMLHIYSGSEIDYKTIK